MTSKQFKNWRVFPMIGMIFMGVMLVWFNTWFFATPVDKHSEFSLVQYGVITGMYVGLLKFYFETGNNE